MFVIHAHAMKIGFVNCLKARAPHSPVIIVATHLDKVPSNQQKELKAQYQRKIKELYERSGFPTIKDIIEVSAVTKEGEFVLLLGCSLACCLSLAVVLKVFQDCKRPSWMLQFRPQIHTLRRK